MVLAITFKHNILNDNHKNLLRAHACITKIYKKIRTNYYWPNMQKYIKQYAIFCTNCQKRNTYKIAKPSK